MVIQPRQVEPGALLRWSRQALALIGRGWSYWLGMLLLLCLAIFLGQHLPLVSGVLSLMALFGSILVAAALDGPEVATFDDVLGAIRGHGGTVLWFSVVIAVAGAVIWVLLLAGPGVSPWNVIYTDRNSVTALSADGFLALRQIFVYSAYALGLSYFGLNLPGLTAFFQFPCTTLLGMPFRDAYRAGAAAQMKNLVPMAGVGLLFILLPVAAILVFPLAVPLLYCFLGALAYVGFRDIFLGRPDNRVRETSANRAGATAVSGSGG